MTFCRMCGRPCVYEVEPAVLDEQAIVEDDVYLVAMANGLYIEACGWCWLKWPNGHKVVPVGRYGNCGEDSPVELLQETA